MSSPETYIAFAAIMLVIALLAVAIDWFGKPLRHRKFVPKIYRFPDERMPRRAPQRVTPWSDAALVLPVSEGTLEPAQAPVAAAVAAPPATPLLPALAPGRTPEVAPVSPYPDEHPNATPLSPYPDEHPNAGPPSPYPDEQPSPDASIDAPEPLVVDADRDGAAEATSPSVSVFADAEPAAAEEPNHEPAADPDDPRPTGADGRIIGWKPGDYVFNLTGEGREPSPSTVRARFWKNVGATAGASMFGDSNLDRLLRGKPPQRRNPRTRKMESMHLPTVGYHDDDGKLPVPAWPTSEPDPFADR